DSSQRPARTDQPRPERQPRKKIVANTAQPRSETGRRERATKQSTPDLSRRDDTPSQVRTDSPRREAAPTMHVERARTEIPRNLDNPNAKAPVLRQGQSITIPPKRPEAPQNPRTVYSATSLGRNPLERREGEALPKAPLGTPTKNQRENVPVRRETPKISRENTYKQRSDSSQPRTRERSRDTSPVRRDELVTPRRTEAKTPERRQDSRLPELTRRERAPLQPRQNVRGPVKTYSSDKAAKEVVKGENPDAPRTVEKSDAPTHQVSAVSGDVASVDKAAATLSLEEMKALVDKLVDKLYIMKADGSTETTITLKNVPLFEGATVTVKEFDSATGEFNLTFANLSNEAKELLDRQLNQNMLKSSFQEKGFTLHIVTNTTEEVATFTSESESTGEDQEAQEEKRGEEDREKEKQEDKDN
ncbi:MAG: hypothetical protein ACI9S8_002690, partial [Chlamydiales bacterium]